MPDRFGLSRDPSPSSYTVGTGLRLRPPSTEHEVDQPARHQMSKGVVTDRRSQTKAAMKPLNCAAAPAMSSSAASFRAGAGPSAGQSSHRASRGAASHRVCSGTNPEHSVSQQVAAAKARASLTMKPLPSGNPQSLLTTQSAASHRGGSGSHRERGASTAGSGSHRATQSKASKRRAADDAASDRHPRSGIVEQTRNQRSAAPAAAPAVASPMATGLRSNRSGGMPAHRPAPVVMVTTACVPSAPAVSPSLSTVIASAVGASVLARASPTVLASCIESITMTSPPTRALGRTSEFSSAGLENFIESCEVTASPTSPEEMSLAPAESNQTGGALRDEDLLDSVSNAPSLPASRTADLGARMEAHLGSRRVSAPLDTIEEHSPTRSDGSPTHDASAERPGMAGGGGTQGVAVQALPDPPTRPTHAARQRLADIERAIASGGPATRAAALLQSQQGSSATDLAHGLQRLRGEYETLVHRHSDAHVERPGTETEVLRAENAKLKTQVAELTAKLALAVQKSSQGVSSTQLRASCTPVTVEQPQRVTATLEAMRLHDLNLHRQLAAARVIQQEIRRWLSRKRGVRKLRIPITAKGSEPRHISKGSRERSSGTTASMRARQRQSLSPPRLSTSPPRSSRSPSDERSPASVPDVDADASTATSVLLAFKQGLAHANRFAMLPSSFAPGDRSSGVSALRLDRYLGAPSRAIFNAMEREHSSEDKFIANSDGMATCPRSEWLYVISQAVGSRRDRSHDCTPERIGWQLDDFVKSDTARRAGLVQEEVIAVRLYTGPMSQHYNAALTARDKERFTTTIHAVNSAIVKLSKLQQSATVYRVLTIPKAPEQFFSPDALGSITGFEPAFMSTTSSLQLATRHLAEQQAERRSADSQRGGSGKETVVLIRIRVISTDQAADVSFASQSPTEQEIIFAALTTFDVVGHYREHGLATICDLRPRRGAIAKTIAQIIGKMKDSHVELLDLMIDELRAAGAPEPSLLPLNTLRTEREHQVAADFDSMDKFVEYTSSALAAQQRVLRDLSKEIFWQREKGKIKELAQRMFAIVGLQVRAGEHEAASDLARMAIKRQTPPASLSFQLDHAERHAVAVASRQSAAVVKPSEIQRAFPESQHSILQAAILFMSQGLVPPWPPFVAALLAKMTPASHLAFGELVDVHRARIEGRGSNVLVLDEKSAIWREGILPREGGLVQVAGRHVARQPNMRMLWPTDSGAGALLNEAASNGNLALVQTLLRARVELHYSDSQANTVLHRAVLGGHIHVCQLLLDANADPMAINTDGLSAWDLALRGGHPAVRRVFSPSCADLDVEGGAVPVATVTDHMNEKEYVRQLLQCAMRGDTTNLIVTITDAAEKKLRVIDKPNRLHVTPLMFAARSDGGHEAVDLLIRYGATVSLKTGRSSSALLMAAEAGSVDAVEVLLGAGADMDIDALDARGYSALHMAVENRHRGVSQLLLDHGANVLVPRRNHWTCVLTAAYYGVTDVLQLLVEHSADVNATFKSGKKDTSQLVDSFAPAHLAAYNGFESTLVELGRLGADVNQTMGNGWSPLMVAAAQGQAHAVSSLLAMKANIDYQGSVDRLSALMVAAWSKQGTACMGLLLQARANVHLHDSSGSDVLMMCSRLGQSQAVQHLLLQRAEPKAARVGGTTALMDAAAAGSEDIVKMLIAVGADVDAADDEGVSVLMHAANGGQELAVLPLLQAGADVQRMDLTHQPTIAYATTKPVARRLLEAGATTDRLKESLCAELGLRAPHRSSVATDSVKAVSRAAHTRPQSSAAVRPTAKQSKMVGVTRLMRAGDPTESTTKLLRTYLYPLKLTPTVADTAPLLQVYRQNATAAQTGAATIIQRRFRSMRLRRQREQKMKFYLPRNVLKKPARYLPHRG